MKICPACRGTYDDEHAFCPEDGTPLDDAPVSKKGLGGEGLVGELVAGRYRIEKFLGGGGFGVVYRVRDELLDDVEALKIVKSDMLSAKEARETLARFNREAKLLRRLGKRSRHIVGVTNLGEDPELGLFFTMEYVPGGDLKQALEASDGPFEFARVLKIGQQICDALSTAHGFSDAESGYPDGVVHRDLKLDNVMLVERGGQEWVKILDFGIAKILGGKTVAMDSSTGGPGTPGYAPPEQILNPKEIDRRSDIFPLGVILYRLATGREPWFGRGMEEERDSGGMSWMAVVDRTLRETPIPPRDFNESLPHEFQSFILKCLEKDKKDRFGTAAEAAEALKAIERQLATPAGEAPTMILRPESLPSHRPPRPAAPPAREHAAPPEVAPHPDVAASGAEPAAARPVASRRRRARNRPEAPDWLQKAIRPGLAVLGLLALLLVGQSLIPRATQIDWATFSSAAELGQVATVELRGTELRGTSLDPEFGTFTVPVEGRDLQALGLELEALGVAIDPEGRPATVRLDGEGGGDSRILVIEGADGCEPCSSGARIELAAGWHTLRWQDSGPDTGSIVVSDLDGRVPDARIRLGPSSATESEESPPSGRIFVGHRQRLSFALPTLPSVSAASGGAAGDCEESLSALLTAYQDVPTGRADLRARGLWDLEGRIREAMVSGVCADGGQVDRLEALLEDVGRGYGALADAARAAGDRGTGQQLAAACLTILPDEPSCAGVLEWSQSGEVGEIDGGLDPDEAGGALVGGADEESELGNDLVLLPVCSNLASVRITDFAYNEAERTFRLAYEAFFDAPGLEAPPVQAIEMSLSFQVDGQPAGTVDFTHRSPEGAVVRNGRTGYEGTRSVGLDEAAGGISLDGVRVSALLRAQPVQPPNWPAGCAPPGFMESNPRDVVVASTLVGALSRGVLQFTVGDLQVSDEPERALATVMSVELEGEVGKAWCAAGVFTLAVGDNEFGLGTAVQPLEQAQTRSRETVRFWTTLEEGNLPSSVPNEARGAQARASARIYDQACATLDLGTAVPVRVETVGPICVQKSAATAWEPCD